jgi:Zn-dependent protease
MDPMFFALAIVILLFSVIVHEVMHGYVALRFGDHTAENAGRLTLNPIPHIDPVGTILVPLVLIVANAPFLLGWAKPVPVNPLNFSNIRRGELFVSLAGVGSNFILALIAATIYHFLPFVIVSDLIQSALAFMVTINLVLGIFNLLPVPPLDGYNALLSQLPYKAAREYQKAALIGPVLILVMLAFGLLGPIFRVILLPLLSLLQIPPQGF